MSLLSNPVGSMGATVVRLILHDWSEVRSWWQSPASMETQAQALSLLAKVIMVDSKVSDIVPILLKIFIFHQNSNVMGKSPICYHPSSKRDCFKFLHMPWQHSCLGICKNLLWSDEEKLHYMKTKTPSNFDCEWKIISEWENGAHLMKKFLLNFRFDWKHLFKFSLLSAELFSGCKFCCSCICLLWA